MAKRTTDQRSFLLLKTRNLGDAVIGTALVETLAHAFPTSRIDVLTRPEIANIFTCNPHVHQVFSGRFPMGSVHDFGLKEALRLPSLLWQLRGRHYTDVLNAEGDFREELLATLITRDRNWSPTWPPGHPFTEVIRQPAIHLANRPIPIPHNVVNVHEAVALMGTAITGAPAQTPALYTPSKTRLTWTPQPLAVGLHPMASQPWRCWPLEKWAAIAQALIAHGLHVHVFGAPSEAAELHKHFGHLNPAHLTLLTGSLSSYFSTVATMRVFLCPDSFAAHVAYALGVPTILLNGANDFEAWAPPGTLVLAEGPTLPCYPCYNRPTCVATPHEFACVRRISEQSVLDTVQQVLSQTAAQTAPTLFQAS